MKKFLVKLAGLLALAAIVAESGFLVFCAANGISGKAPEPQAEEVQDVQKAPEKKPDTVSTLCVAGDLVMHMPIVNEAYNGETGKYDFKYLFDQVKHYYEDADSAFACLETTFNGPPYSGYPQFCAPDELASDLKAVGFDLLSTVGNHSLDTYYEGLVRTLDVLDAAGLQHIGTYRTEEDAGEVKVIDVGGISLAVIGFTYGTNGIPMGDHPYSVKVFADDYTEESINVNYDKIAEELERAKGTGADAIAVYMHWGQEYSTTPSDQQKELADFLFEHGATLILGGHVHVPQPMETRTLSDGRTGYLCYCLGNFISNQFDPYTNLTAAVNIELTKNGETGAVTVSNVGYVPMFMLHADSANDGRYHLLDIKETMKAYEGGDESIISSYNYDRLKQGLTDLRTIFGIDENGNPVGANANQETAEGNDSAVIPMEQSGESEAPAA